MTAEQFQGDTERALPIGEVVARLRPAFPDVSHSSLRFLEREGLIAARRTPGGHRLYAPDTVTRIRQIKRWQAQRLSLDEIQRRLTRLDDLPPPAAIAATFVDQALAGDLLAAYRTILAADDVGLPLAELFGKVLQPALADIGRRWAAGELLVAQEKEISELARDLIADLTLRHAHPQPGAPAIVAACVEGERHELGLRVICGLLREQGYAVHYLGADVAARFLGEAVQLHRPALVLLSVKLTENLPAVSAAIEHVTNALNPAPTPLIVVGGQGTRSEPEAIRAWGAVPIGDQDLDQAVAAVVAMLPPPAADPSSPAWQ